MATRNIKRPCISVGTIEQAMALLKEYLTEVPEAWSPKNQGEWLEHLIEIGIAIVEDEVGQAIRDKEGKS